MKRGFTLVELLCVIVIIAIISLITFPKITRHINNAREELYITQIKNIEKIGERWALDNADYLDKFHINDTFISLNLLRGQKYLEYDDILNPKTKESMEGCILINYSNNKYSYEYVDVDCTLSANDLSEYSDSYIVYDYDDDAYEIVKINEKANTPAYQDILNNNPNLYVLGERNDGLYELEDEYVFRGNNVNNYVKYEGKEWRILSIDKNDYSMKLISTTIDSSTLSSNTAVSDFTKTTLQNSLLEKVSEYEKINDKWNNGIIGDNNSNVQNIKNILKNNTIISKVGLLSVYDYAVASTDENCESNLKNTSCKNNNYIATMYSGKDFWTMNTDGSKFWYINSDNELKLDDSNSGPYYYSMVIKVPINVYCSNIDTATGSSSQFAYELK